MTLQPSGPGRPAGHRSLPHTADAQVEAWAPSREECLGEAVLGSVELFVDITDARPTGTHALRLPTGSDDEQLVHLLEEMVFLLDTTGRVPVRVAVVATRDGVEVRLDTVEVAALPQTGAVPKAVSLHDLRFGRTAAGWSCLVTWDV